MSEPFNFHSPEHKKKLREAHKRTLGQDINRYKLIKSSLEEGKTLSEVAKMVDRSQYWLYERQREADRFLLLYEDMRWAYPLQTSVVKLVKEFSILTLPLTDELVQRLKIFDIKSWLDWQEKERESRFTNLPERAYDYLKKAEIIRAINDDMLIPQNFSGFGWKSFLLLHKVLYQQIEED